MNELHPQNNSVTSHLRSALLWLLPPVLLLAIALPLAAEAPGDIAFERQGSEAEEDITFPPSIFPHWLHRVRYRCDACHDSLFKMEAGANEVTMDLMSEGKVCGACHNGERAFLIGLENCHRCHREPD